MHLENKIKDYKNNCKDNVIVLITNLIKNNSCYREIIKIKNVKYKRLKGCWQLILNLYANSISSTTIS